MKWIEDHYALGERGWVMREYHSENRRKRRRVGKIGDVE
jgi:hypothetical protein